MATSKLYLVGKDIVEGVRSEGGLFYDVKIVATGEKFRILTEVFEAHAREIKCQETSN